MRCSRKGSLSLSINAIVVLILAITMLSLGLTFMRGMFGKMSATTSTSIDAIEVTNPPTEDNPITTTPNKLELREGERAMIVVSVMNAKGADRWCKHETAPIASGLTVPTVATAAANCDKYDRYQINKYGITVATSTGQNGIYLQPVTVKCYSASGCTTTNLAETYTTSFSIDVTT
ncbi:hypothetical protein J4460_03430 [Candidatus Woesearchaeota archaeon]|nr:MAG: hypothetical protein QS99_C0008G0056 [archaeon GW2011_AR4]MBS3129700.1 hypothetical protein [Candidatus Woesearchaeota archaeon]HIH38804.1 hypothetical protein [Candidatus Woesearchaeota archaeon]HIH49219.1 hypothetical protein [Candidatus Woesearchaeota archaeon]HIJ03362.1 hypothetical protein [Candidatus Woesearchaeota archaeon]